jgi:hypothetical protein
MPRGINPSGPTSKKRPRGPIGIDCSDSRVLKKRPRGPIGIEPVGKESQCGYSIAVSGESFLLGIFITDVEQQLPGTTLYDRTDKFIAFAGREVELGKSGFLNKEGRKAAKRIEKNLKTPTPTDVKVHFSESGKDIRTTIVSINGTRGHRVLSLTVDFENPAPDGPDGWERLYHFVNEIIKAVQQVH